jgi:hypothetical protein
MVKNKKFYPDNVMFGAILLVLGTAMVFATAISAPIPAAARPPQEGEIICDIGSDGDEPDDVFVNGVRGHEATNDNGEHSGCMGQVSNPPTSGGARVDEIEDGDLRCHGVATPSGQGNFVCNTNENRK